MDPSETLQSRANKLRSQIEAMRTAWPFLLPILQERRDEKTQALIAKEDPEVRGQIKAYQGLIELPETVRAELEQLEQAIEDLPDSSAA